MHEPYSHLDKAVSGASETRKKSCLNIWQQVGFNFGSWQIWNLRTLTLDFSSVYEGSGSTNFTMPITGFAFTEPENDPRNFCFVWIVRSEADFDSVEEKADNLKSKATISMHALSFRNRDELSGNFYSGLTSCSFRFHHALDGDPQTRLNNEVVNEFHVGTWVTLQCRFCHWCKEGKGRPTFSKKTSGSYDPEFNGSECQLVLQYWLKILAESQLHSSLLTYIPFFQLTVTLLVLMLWSTDYNYVLAKLFFVYSTREYLI